MNAEFERLASCAKDAEAEIWRLRAMLEKIGELLEANGCDCDCGHDHGDHDEGCDVCLPCRISDAMVDL